MSQHLAIVPRVIQPLTSSVIDVEPIACNEPSEHLLLTTFFQLRNSGNQRKHFERNMAERKRTISYQLGRNPNNDQYEYDACADPRHVAHLRNKQAQQVSKKQQDQSIDAANNIIPFIRIENVTA